jgi:HAD superfamily hydrolase (TIGR01509 family)
MTKGIIFDFDGILVDSEQVNIDAAIKTFSGPNPLVPEEVTFIPGRSSADFIPLFCHHRGIDQVSQHQKLYDQNKQNYNELWATTVVMVPHMKRTVETLFQQKRMLGIATTNRREIIDLFFEKFGMSEHFSSVVTGDEVKKRKPDPEVYIRAIKKLRLKKAELIAVEDTSIGVLAAKRAGLRCAALPNRYSKNQDFDIADFVLKSAGDILTIL